MPSKYEPLHRYLAALTDDERELSFADIERILGLRLPDSARKYNAWWDNPTDGKTHPYSYAWLDAGYYARHIDRARERVTFIRQGGNAR